MPACLPPLRHTAAPASPCFPSFPFSAVMPVVCTLPHGACLPDESPFPLRTLCSPYGVQGVGISFYHSDSAPLSTICTTALSSRELKNSEKKEKERCSQTLRYLVQPNSAEPFTDRYEAPPLCSLVGPGRLAVAVHDAGVLPCAWRQASRQDGGTWQWRAHTRARDTRPRSAPARPCASRRPAAHAASLKCG